MMPPTNGTKNCAAFLEQAIGADGSSIGKKFMSVRSFFDANVLAYTDDEIAPKKKIRALSLLKEHQASGSGVVSLQVLQEYFVTATKKMNVDSQLARRKVEMFSNLEVGEPELADLLAAIDLHRLHGFSFWDCLIIRMAQQTGCKIIYSEDLQHTQTVSGIKIVNPFV
jgi:predicted nucleic acid-binding protein